ncbi:MAG: chemotaxis protein methyltransferase CheR [Actinomycetota bacterium]|nr:chemotaxis protein methyltransferase CheR [Actinomycetota bacterium]
MLEPAELDGAVDHVLAAVLATRGADFNNYQRPFVIRRLRRVADRHRMNGGVTELAARVGENPLLVDDVIDSLSLGFTHLFRDPGMWATLRSDVLPAFDSRTLVRAWVAGAATGEEAYSLAITLVESGLSPQRFRIYATDINEQSLAQARAGFVAPDRISAGNHDYLASGGTAALADYFPISGGGSTGEEPLFDRKLSERIVFARHNLASDASFNSFDLILCRNVLIYFNAELHARVHEILFESLVPGGVLGLGSRESSRGSAHARQLDTIDQRSRLYRRKW